MGQLDSLVVHLLYFRGYEQHIQIGRLLHMQLLTQGSPFVESGWSIWAVTQRAQEVVDME